MRKLSKVGRRLSVEHIIHHAGHQQVVALYIISGLKTGQRHMHRLCRSHIIDTPGIRHPVGRGNGFVVGILHSDMRDMRSHPVHSLISLSWRTGPAVNRRIDAPNGRRLMLALQSHTVFILCPDTLLAQPQSLVHRFEDSLSLLLIRFSILTNDVCDTRGQQIATVVVGRRMGHGTTTII